MPLYEYECDKCGHRFEKIQKFSDPPLDVCPKCGGTLHKMQSAPAFQFKGTGWYVTDYAKSGKTEGKPASKDSKPETDTAKSEPAKIETKPATPAKGDTKSGD